MWEGRGAGEAVDRWPRTTHEHSTPGAGVQRARKPIPIPIPISILIPIPSPSPSSSPIPSPIPSPVPSPSPSQSPSILGVKAEDGVTQADPISASSVGTKSPVPVPKPQHPGVPCPRRWAGTMGTQPVLPQSLGLPPPSMVHLAPTGLTGHLSPCGVCRPLGRYQAMLTGWDFAAVVPTQHLSSGTTRFLTPSSLGAVPGEKMETGCCCVTMCGCTRAPNSCLR